MDTGWTGGSIISEVNQMPYQTSYGYSGYNAYPAKSQSNVALYAGGGLLAGAFVGYAAWVATSTATTTILNTTCFWVRA